jgi:hypothetical protein
VLAAPALPFVEPLDAYLERRLAQRALNVAVLGQRSDLQAKMLKLKDRIRREAFVGADGTPLRPGMAGAWWRQLEPTSAAAQKLEKWLDRMLEAPVAEVEQDIHGRLGAATT